jgi:hypothetical protein
MKRENRKCNALLINMYLKVAAALIIRRPDVES